MALGLAWRDAERLLMDRAAARFAQLPLADLAIEAALLRAHADDASQPQLERTRSRRRIVLIRQEIAARQRAGRA